MDNVCHTLVGAAFGEAGLKRRTRFGSATLMIAANLPDLDVLVFATDVPSVAFRRGWTHGTVAQLLLPIALTAIMVALGRARPARYDATPVRVGALLLLSYVGVLSHVGLDLLNTYGIRLLMPFDGRWFYGDAVFIIDPWLWLALGVGLWYARRRGTHAPLCVRRERERRVRALQRPQCLDRRRQIRRRGDLRRPGCEPDHQQRLRSRLLPHRHHRRHGGHLHPL